MTTVRQVSWGTGPSQPPRPAGLASQAEQSDQQKDSPGRGGGGRPQRRRGRLARGPRAPGVRGPPGAQCGKPSVSPPGQAFSCSLVGGVEPHPPVLMGKLRLGWGPRGEASPGPGPPPWPWALGPQGSLGAAGVHGGVPKGHTWVASGNSEAGGSFPGSPGPTLTGPAGPPGAQPPGG